MSKRTKTLLQQWFADGTEPTGTQFADWLDSYFHKDEGKIIKSNEDLGNGKIRLTFNDDTSITIVDYSAVKSDTVASFATGNALTANDNGNTLTFDNANAVTVTIPHNDTINFNIGTKINLVQLGVGQVEVIGAANVTVICAELTKTRKINSLITITKLEANTWLVFGDIQDNSLN